MRNYVFYQQDTTTPPPPPPPPTSYSSSQPNYTGGDKASSRALWALILGIAAWVLGCGLLTGIPAWIMGKKEINEIEAGRSSAAGLTMAKIGMWLGLINTILGILALFIVAILFVAGVIAIPFME